MNHHRKIGIETPETKELIFFTNHYPFHFSDSYIDDEMAILSGRFKKIRVFSLNRDDSPMRPVPINVEASRVHIEFYRRHYLRALGLFFKRIFWIELFEVLFIYRRFPGAGVLKSIYKYWARALAYKEFLEKKTEGRDEIFVYTYFMLECALAALMLKGRKKVHLVSRLHGYDVYFERGEYGYLPFRGHFIKNLDALFFISENGKQYLADKLKLHDTPLMAKLRIARLGFHSPFSEEITGMRNVPFRLVSTAWILENKRLKLIAEALTMLPHDVKIEWVHFGGYYGIDKEYHDTFIARVEEIRSSFPNISIRLMGSTPKEEILRFYRENEVHVFINASASEGIPVSMMEACRHGIPIIGTLVGGVGEILDDGYNGFHLNPNPAIEDIAIKLLEIIRMSDREYYFLRSNALQRWKDRYDSQRNYHRFLQELLRVWKLPQA